MVLAQTVFSAWLLIPGASFQWNPAGSGLCVVGAILLVWALIVNRPGNFRILPEIREGAHLVQAGPYRWICHPMYTALLLVTLAGLSCQFSWLRLVVWLCLLGVLYAKALREEGLLISQFPDYTAYRARTGRFLPRLGDLMTRIRPGWVVMFGLAVTVLLLRAEGRIRWCACGKLNLWDGDIWSAHNSQHVFDPYSFTHVLHGILLFWILRWVFRRMAFSWLVTLALLGESAWEVVENSSFIIQRYREATIGQGYVGDSIINSLADIVCCAAGVLLARKIGFRLAFGLFVIVELALALVVRDNLTLNILMLICPIDAVKQWQMVH